ncbi:MAG TPA: YecA family protein [Leucothrix sp.]|nr:YecA family protein [Leucothrix sp.]
MNDKMKKILAFGEKRSSEWPDYLNYFNLAQVDIPDLINIVSDKNLHNADTNSKEVWAPLHAWRALGQLKAKEAVQPLIDQFEYLVDDDWALSELQKVMGLIGKPAIEPLVNYFLSGQPSEYARVIAMNGLAEIAKDNSKFKSNILMVFKNYLEKPDKTLGSLNGLLIARLMDLKAAELIDEIRSLFKLNCMDYTICGDLEDVEIALGLRMKRETPKPHYGMLWNNLHKDDDNNIDDFEVFDDIDLETDFQYTAIDMLLDKYGHDDSILNASELDGFFASIACAPNMIMPSVWMPAIWGGEDKSPEWEDQGEAEGFINLIMQYYNQVLSYLLEGNYEALFHQRESEGKTYLIVDEWCEGFARALPLWPISRYQHDKAILDFLTTISLFTTEEGLDEIQNLSSNEIETQQGKIEPALNQLYLHYQGQRKSGIKSSVQTIIRKEPKISRNSPCPCGSGKKFKKCCLH